MTFNDPNDFAKGAGKSKKYADGRPVEVAEDKQWPWEKYGVTKPATHVFNLRIPEPLNMKLDYLVYQGKLNGEKITKHDICLEAIKKYTQVLLKEKKHDTGGGG